jgi:hypothetical protein
MEIILIIGMVLCTIMFTAMAMLFHCNRLYRKSMKDEEE